MSSTSQGPMSPDSVGFTSTRPSKRSLEPQGEEQTTGEHEERSKRRRNEEAGPSPGVEGSRAQASNASMERGIREIDLTDDRSDHTDVPAQGTPGSDDMDVDPVEPAEPSPRSSAPSTSAAASLPPLEIPRASPRRANPPEQSTVSRPRYAVNVPGQRSVTAPVPAPSTDSVRADLARAQAFSDALSPLRSSPAPRQPSVETAGSRMPYFGGLERIAPAAPRVLAPMPSRMSSPLGTGDAGRALLPDRHTPLSLSLPPLRPSAARRPLPPQPPSPPRPESHIYNNIWLPHPSLGGPSMLPAGQAGVRHVAPPAPHSPTGFFSPPAPPPPGLAGAANAAREARSSSLGSAARRSDAFLHSGLRESARMRDLAAYEVALNDRDRQLQRLRRARDRALDMARPSSELFGDYSPPLDALPLPLIGRGDGDIPARHLPRPSWMDAEALAAPSPNIDTSDRTDRTSMTLAPIRTRGPLPDFSSVVRDSAADRPDDPERAERLSRLSQEAHRRLSALEENFMRLDNVLGAEQRQRAMEEETLVGNAESELATVGGSSSSGRIENLQRQNRIAALLSPDLPSLNALTDHQPVQLVPPPNHPDEPWPTEFSPALEGDRSSSRRPDNAILRRILYQQPGDREPSDELLDLREILRQAEARGDRSQSERASGDLRPAQGNLTVQRPLAARHVEDEDPMTTGDFTADVSRSGSRENSLGLSISPAAQGERSESFSRPRVQIRPASPLGEVPVMGTTRASLRAALSALRTDQDNVLQRMRAARPPDGEDFNQLQQAARHLSEAVRNLRAAMDSEVQGRRILIEANARGSDGANSSNAMQVDDASRDAEFLRLMSETEPLLAHHRAQHDALSELMEASSVPQENATQLSRDLGRPESRLPRARDGIPLRVSRARTRFSLPNVPPFLPNPPATSLISAAPAPVSRYDPVRDRDESPSDEWRAATDLVRARHARSVSNATSQRHTGVTALAPSASARASQGTQTSLPRPVRSQASESLITPQRLALWERVRSREADRVRDTADARQRDTRLRPIPTSSPSIPPSSLTDLLLGSPPPRDMSRAEERLLRRNRPESVHTDDAATVPRPYLPFRASSPEHSSSSGPMARLERIIAGQEDEMIRAMNPDSFGLSGSATLQVPADSRRNPDRQMRLSPTVPQYTASALRALASRTAALENAVEQIRDESSWPNGGTAEDEEQRRYRAYQSSWQDVLNERYGQQPAQSNLRTTQRVPSSAAALPPGSTSDRVPPALTRENPVSDGYYSAAPPAPPPNGPVPADRTRERPERGTGARGTSYYSERLSRLMNLRDGHPATANNSRLGMLLNSNWRSHGLGDELDMSYESLVRLSERVGPAVPPGVPSSILERLRTGPYRDAPDADDTKTCSICLEDYAETDSVTYLDNCSHWFHKPCIETWLGRASTCPCCRSRVGQNPAQVQSAARQGGSRLLRVSRAAEPTPRFPHRLPIRTENPRPAHSTTAHSIPPSGNNPSSQPQVQNAGSGGLLLSARFDDTAGGSSTAGARSHPVRRRERRRARSDNDAASSTVGNAGSVNDEDILWMADSDSDETMSFRPDSDRDASEWF